MHTPQGDFVCLFHESEDLAKAFQTIATSQDPSPSGSGSIWRACTG